MNLHEYQAKQILSSFGVPVPKGIMAETIEQAVDAAKEIQKLSGSQFCVVKAQIHAGGRGKGGGVKLAKSLDDAREKATNILGMNLITPQTGAQGKLVRKVLIQEDVYYPGNSETKEFYLSMLTQPSGRESYDYVFNRRRYGYRRRG
jgi:succinyl-CoA synthetase beta subunit